MALIDIDNDYKLFPMQEEMLRIMEKNEIEIFPGDPGKERMGYTMIEILGTEHFYAPYIPLHITAPLKPIYITKKYKEIYTDIGFRFELLDIR